MNRDKKEVAYCQIDAQLLDKKNIVSQRATEKANEKF